MIELIFVIAIIGILAAIAATKLSATRDDAKVVAALDSGKQVMHNLMGEYTAKGALSKTSITEANTAAPCFNFAFNSKTAALTVKENLRNKNCGISTAAQKQFKDMAAHNGFLSSGAKPKTYNLGGSQVKF